MTSSGRTDSRRWNRGDLALVLFALLVVVIAVSLFTWSTNLELVEIDPGSSSEVVALQTEVSTIHAYEERFFQLVLWSLGALLVASFGWFANNRIYEGEIARIRLEADQMIKDALAQFDARMSSTQEWLDDSAAEATAREEHLRPTVQSDIDAVRNHIGQILSNQNRLSADLNNLHLRVIALDSMRSREHKSYELVAHYQLERLKILADDPDNNGPAIAKTLLAMKDAIENSDAGAMYPIHYDLTTELTRLSEKTGPEHAEDIQELLSLLRTKRF